MSNKTSIEWTATVHPDGSVTPGRTWNPVTGCTKVSAGCKHCYAETIAKRFWATQYPAIGTGAGLHADGDRPRQFTDVMEHADRLYEPFSWKKPTRVFVNSMSDLFQEDVSNEFIARVFAVMAFCRQHTFQVLTKRPERMAALISDEDFRSEVDVWISMMLDDEDRPKALAWDPLARRSDDANALAPDVHDADGWPLRHVWLGFSAEDQPRFNERWPHVSAIAGVGWTTFCSAEPLLGPIDMTDVESVKHKGMFFNALTDDFGPLAWVIVGGESGYNSRPCGVGWIRSLVDQCQTASVPVFVKQLGGTPVERDGDCGGGLCCTHPDCQRDIHILSLDDRKGGDPIEWPSDLRVREFPAASVGREVTS